MEEQRGTHDPEPGAHPPEQLQVQRAVGGGLAAHVDDEADQRLEAPAVGIDRHVLLHGGMELLGRVEHTLVVGEGVQLGQTSQTVPWAAMTSSRSSSEMAV